MSLGAHRSRTPAAADVVRWRRSRRAAACHGAARCVRFAPDWRPRRLVVRKLRRRPVAEFDAVLTGLGLTLHVNHWAGFCAEFDVVLAEREPEVTPAECGRSSREPRYVRRFHRTGQRWRMDGRSAAAAWSSVNQTAGGGCGGRFDGLSRRSYKQPALQR